MKFDLQGNFWVSTALFLCAVFSSKATYRILYNFTGGSNDKEKLYCTTQVPPGTELYGVTSDEAAATDGTIFKINNAILAGERLDCGL